MTDARLPRIDASSGLTCVSFDRIDARVLRQLSFEQTGVRFMLTGASCVVTIERCGRIVAICAGTFAITGMIGATLAGIKVGQAFLPVQVLY